jgi:uncharacterized protein with HEPN domain
MPPRDWAFRLRDILEAIEGAQSYVEGMDLEGFESNQMVVDAVLRKLTIIGEAAAGIPEDVRRELPDIPWPEIVAMRNIVVHHYFGVSLQIVWHTVNHDLGPLQNSIRSFLETDRC